MGDKWEVTSYGVSCWGQLLLTKAYCHTKTNVVIFRGLKRICESKMGTPSSVGIIEDVDLALKVLVIVYRSNGSAAEGLADRNKHRRKGVCKGKIISWGGERTKGNVCKCELTKNMFLHSDLLKLCLKGKEISLTSFPTKLFLTVRKLALRGNKVKR